MKIILPVLMAIIISGGGVFYWQNGIVTDYKVQKAVLEKDLSETQQDFNDLSQEKENLLAKQADLEKEVADLEDEVSDLEKEVRSLKPRDTVTFEDSGITFTKPNANDHLRGAADAKVTLVLYSDIDCPFCQRFHTTTQELLAAYPDDLNVVYRHFPLTQLHPDAAKKAEASECIAELGGNEAFWDFLDILFAEKTSADELASVAVSIGVDSNDFQDCFDSGKYTTKVSDSYNEAIAAGGRGTPYSILYDGQKTVPVNGALPLQQVKTQIDSLLK